MESKLIQVITKWDCLKLEDVIAFTTLLDTVIGEYLNSLSLEKLTSIKMDIIKFCLLVGLIVHLNRFTVSYLHFMSPYKSLWTFSKYLKLRTTNYSEYKCIIINYTNTFGQHSSVRIKLQILLFLLSFLSKCGSVKAPLVTGHIAAVICAVNQGQTSQEC